MASVDSISHHQLDTTQWVRNRRAANGVADLLVKSERAERVNAVEVLADERSSRPRPVAGTTVEKYFKALPDAG